MIHAYDTGHINCATVMKAVAAGVPGAQVVVPSHLRDGAAIFYGILRGTGALVRDAIARKLRWYYVDNGYFRPGHYAGFYRVSAGSYQYQGPPAPAWDRWRALGLTVRPWQRTGSHVLICPPSAAYAQHHGLSQNWGAQMAMEVRRHTDRPLIVRDKKSRTPLADDLKRAWALVTYASNAALAALLDGVPVIALGDCGAAALAQKLECIESPDYGIAREEWFATLAGQQWTLDEFRDGTMWRQVHGHR